MRSSDEKFQSSAQYNAMECLFIEDNMELKVNKWTIKIESCVDKCCRQY